MRTAPIAIDLLMLLSLDNPQGLPWRSTSAPSPDVLAGMKIPVLPDFSPVRQSAASPDPQPANSQSSTQSQGDVKNVSDNPRKPGPPSELMLVRFVDGEYAHAVRSLPNG